MADKFSEKNMGDKSLRARAKGLEARIEALENSFGRLLHGLDQRLNNVGQMLAQQAELLEAVMEEVGSDVVTEILNRKRLERAQKAEADEVAKLAEAVADGYVTPAEVIAEDSFLVGFETDGAGKPLGGTGRQQVAVKTLRPEFKEQLLGKGVGMEIKTPTGGSFVVREVYTLDEAKYVEVEKAKAEAAQKAAEEAASKDEEN